MCGPKGCVFFRRLGHKLGIVFNPLALNCVRKSYFSISIDKTINIGYRIDGQVINRKAKIAKFGQKYGTKGIGTRAEQPRQIFMGVPPGGEGENS